MTEPTRGSMPNFEEIAAEVPVFEDGSMPPPPDFFDNFVTAVIPPPVDGE